MGQVPEIVTLYPNGSFRICEAMFRMEAFSEQWKLTTPSDWSDLQTKRCDKSGVEVSAVMPIQGKLGDITEVITPLSDREFSLDFQAKFREPTVVNSIHGTVQLPAGERIIYVDGKKVHLPSNYSDMIVFSKDRAREVSICVGHGYVFRVRGTLKMMIQDDRKFMVDQFSLRFFATPTNGQITEASLQLAFEVAAHVSSVNESGTALQLPASVGLGSNGSLWINESRFRFEMFSLSWKCATNLNWTDIKAKKFDRTGVELTGVVSVEGKLGDVVESITPLSESEFSIDFHVDFREPTDVASLHGAFLLPVGDRLLEVDGQSLTLPKDFVELIPLPPKNANEICFSLGGGYRVRVKGNPLHLMIQDDRKYHSPTFALRLFSTPNKGKINHSELHLHVTVFEPEQSKLGGVDVTIPEQVELLENGSFKIGDATVLIESFGSQWQYTANSGWKDVKDMKFGRSGVELSAVMPVAGQFADVRESITPVSETEFRLDFQAKFREPTKINSLHAAIRIPTEARLLYIDDQAIQLPETFHDMVIGRYKAGRISIPVEGGVVLQVTGDPLNVFIQDNRRFNMETFAIRLYATPSQGCMTQSELHLPFQLCRPKTWNVGLASVVNASLSELCSLSNGSDVADVEIDSIRVDNIAINLSRSENKQFLLVKDKCNLDLPKDNTATAVTLIHTCFGSQNNGETIGNIVVDDSSEVIPVVAGRDCSSFLNPIRGKNSAIAWEMEHSDDVFVLYASTFILQKPNPKALRFESLLADTKWAIASVTLSDAPIRFFSYSREPIERKEDHEWMKLTYKRVLNSGSPLDFSFLVDAPAGKYGFIRPKSDGTLTFSDAPDKRIRLFGVNLCFTASFLEKDQAEKLADYLVYCGYNSIRIHHHDTLLTDETSEDSVTFNKSQLDKLDYLVFCMKQRGIYVTSDLYTNRNFKRGDRIPECEDYSEKFAMKMLLPISHAALENWKEFARRWMTHKNPYTGLTWAEEPALYCLNLVNEETLRCYWNQSPSIAKLYKEAYVTFCNDKKIDGGEASRSNPLFLDFLNEIQGKVLDEQIRFAKETLNVQALITSLNYCTDMPLTVLRNKFDLVDNHAYFDHPGFPQSKWCLPFSYRQGSAIRCMASVPRNLMPTRIPEKPFISTEFNYCSPNIHRAEGGPLIGAYAALQGWDALYHFEWSHSSKGVHTVSHIVTFDISSDPLGQLADRISMAMFCRGDVSSAQEMYVYPVSGGEHGGFPVQFEKLGLITKIGSVPGDVNAPGVQKLTKTEILESSLQNKEIEKLWRAALEKKRAVSATGEIQLDSENGIFIVSSPCTQSITLPLGSAQADVLRVKDASCFQTVAAISLDGIPLQESKSVLIIHLTNVTNTGMRFSDGSFTLLERNGNAPLLVKRGNATIELICDCPYQVTALDCDGRPYGNLPSDFHANVFSFKADTNLFKGGVMCYHLTR